MYYNRNSDNSIAAANKVFGPDFILDENMTSETHDGWKWFDVPEDAYAYFANASPNSIKAWQAKAVLSLSGLLTSAEAAIDALPEPRLTIVSSAWANNADFSRDSQTIASLAVALELTSEQLDAMFLQAADLAI